MIYWIIVAKIRIVVPDKFLPSHRNRKVVENMIHSTTVSHNNHSGAERKDIEIVMLRPLNQTTTDPNHYQWNSTDFENLEGLHVIWLDENITKMNDCQDTIEKLSDVVNYLQIFTDADMCVDYITENSTEKIFLIVSNRLRNIIKYVQYFITAAYIFCMKESDPLRDWEMKEVEKLRGIFVDQQKLISKLSKDVLVIMKQTPLTIFETNEMNERSTMVVQEQQSSYVWWHILLGTLVVRHPLYVTNAKEELIEECKLYYKNNKRELEKIREFDRTYSPTDAIKWYTYDSFLYRLLNKALRTQDIDIVFKFRFFLNDLYQQLYKTHLTSIEHLPEKLHVYRGQRMELKEVNILKNNTKNYTSMNTFLSTTLNINIAKIFAGGSDVLAESVLFVITINTKLKKIPFVIIENSAEEEVLISIGAVFQIISVEFDSTDHQWCVKLDLTENIDNKLKELIEHHRPYDSSWKDNVDESVRNMINKFEDLTNEDQSYQLRLGFFLWRIGQTDKGERKIETYLYLSMLYRGKNDTKALEYYRLASEILLAFPRHNLPWLVLGVILREIGHIYLNRNQFDIALKKMQLSRRFIRSTMTGDKMVLYCSIDTSIGMVYFKQGFYEKALESFNEAYALQIEHLPDCHPETALTLQYIGKVYDRLNNYVDSIDAFQKALRIMAICYPWNHETTLTVHILIGSIYEKSNDLSAFIEHYEKGLTIAKSLYRFDDEELIYCYVQLGGIYSKMFYYSLHQMRDRNIAEKYHKLIIELVQQCPPLRNNLNLEKIDRDLKLFPLQFDTSSDDQRTTMTESFVQNIISTATIKREDSSVCEAKSLEEDTELTKTVTAFIRENHKQPLYTLQYYSCEEIIQMVFYFVAIANGCESPSFEISQLKKCFLRGKLTPRYVGMSNEWTHCKHSNFVTCLSSKQQKNRFISFQYDNTEFIKSLQDLMIKYLIDGGQYSDLSIFILESYTLESEFYHRIANDFNKLHPSIANHSLGRQIADLFKYHDLFKKRTYNGKAYRWMKMTHPKSDELPTALFIGMKYMMKSLLSASKLMNENSPILAVLAEENSSVYDDDAYELVLCEFILTEKNMQTSAIDVDTLSLYPDECEVLILPYTVFEVTVYKMMINNQCAFVRLQELLSPRDCRCSHCESAINDNVIIVVPNSTDLPESEVDAIQRRYREKRQIVDSLTIDDIMNP